MSSSSRDAQQQTSKKGRRPLAWGVGLGLGLAALVVGTGFWWQKSAPVDVQAVGLGEWDPADFDSLEPDFESRLQRPGKLNSPASHADSAEQLNLVEGESGRSAPGPALFTSENGNEHIPRLPDGIDIHSSQLANSIDRPASQRRGRHVGAELTGVIEEIPEDEIQMNSPRFPGESARAESHVDFSVPPPSLGQGTGQTISVVPGQYAR